jgi:hypothetical protein
MEHVVAITARVGNGGILTHPKTSIDAGAEMLGKLTIDLLGYLLGAFIGLDAHGGVLSQGDE